MSTTLEFCVDWDAENWLNTPDFTGTYDDISSYVKSYQLRRGIETEQGNAPAGTLNLTLDNSSGLFSPTNSAGDLYGLIRPWLPVRFRATVGVTTYTVYSGFISRISCSPHGSKQTATLYCTDGMDLLARNMVTQDETSTSETSDGNAVGYILDAAGWPSARRSLDTSGGNITKYPLTVEY
jgi:hypothetical protein